MTFPSSPSTHVPTALQTTSKAVSQSPLPQSRETGDVTVESACNEVSITKQGTPVARSWAHFIAGGAGGMTSACLTAPLDVLKTRLQSDFYKAELASTRATRNIPPLSTLSLPRSALLHVRETFQILFSVHRVEGWRALFKGLGPNLIGVVPARAINFYAYGNSKRIISSYFNNGQEAMWVHLSSAVFAGFATSTATNPIWLIKTRLQLDKSHAEKAGTQSQRQYKNSIDCIRKVVRYEGIGGLYRGLSASYLGASESTLQWVLYEQMKLYLSRREQRVRASGRPPNIWDQTVDMFGKLGAAGSAKLFAAVITYPHEVVRTRLRLAPMANGQVKYTGLVQCFRLIWKEEGMAGLYGGLTPHLMRVVPSAAIMFGTYEFLLKAFERP